MRIFVTGSKGFIGSHVVRRLKKAKHQVKGYDLIDGNSVLDFKKLKRKVVKFDPDFIVHLAGQVSLRPSIVNPSFDAATNIIGTINVLECANRAICDVIYSSSGAVYGSNDRSHIDEVQAAEPMSPYGISKRCAEMYCLLYNQLYDMDNVVFRFSSVYGAGRKKTSVNLLLDKALKQVNWKQPEKFEAIEITGDGSQTRDFTHVSDVAEAVLLAIEERFPAGIYNIGTGTSTSVNDLVGLMEKILGKKLIIKHVIRSAGDPPKNDFNVEKASRCGFKAEVSLEDGLRALVKVLSG